MNWIVKNLWLIPALPILAAGSSAPAFEERVARQCHCEYTSAV